MQVGARSGRARSDAPLNKGFVLGFVLGSSLGGAESFVVGLSVAGRARAAQRVAARPKPPEPAPLRGRAPDAAHQLGGRAPHQGRAGRGSGSGAQATGLQV